MLPVLEALQPHGVSKQSISSTDSFSGENSPLALHCQLPCRHCECNPSAFLRSTISKDAPSHPLPVAGRSHSTLRALSGTQL